MAGPSFIIEDLNHDVLLGILSMCDTTRDLCAAIWASPTLYRVFRAFRFRILSNILRHELHVDTIHHAMTVIRLPARTEVTMTVDSDNVPISTMREYVERHSGYNVDSNMTLPTELPELLELAKLNTVVSRLARRFCRGIRGVMDSTSPDKLTAFERQFMYDEALPCDMSAVEMARVKRGLLRLELHFRCFEYDMDEADAVYSTLPIWEKEQSASVFHYLKSKLDYTIMQMEEDFIQDVTSRVRQENKPPVTRRKRKRCADDLVMDQNCTFSRSDLDGLVLYATIRLYRRKPVDLFDPMEYSVFPKPWSPTKDLRGQTIGSLMHRGLQYIESLFQLSLPEYKERIRQDARPSVCFLHLDMHLAGPRPRENMDDVEWEVDRIDRPNWASEFFYNYMRSVNRSWLSVGQWARRRLGAELWDQSGAQRVYEWTSHGGNLGLLRWIDREFGYPRATRSAERVLEGLVLTRRALEEIRKKHAFPGAEFRFEPSVERRMRLRSHLE